MTLQERQLFCMEYFVEHLKWDDYKCAALVGCLTAESFLISSSINKEEKNGTLLVSDVCNKNTAYGTKTSPWAYAAGIAKWKYTNRKELALQLGLGIQQDKAIVIIKSTGIEGLSLEQQLKIIVAEITKGNYKDNFAIVIEKCETLKDAVATVYCRYINGYSSKTSIPTKADIIRINNDYSEFMNRLKYANIVLDNYHKSIDI